jgi:hypothetical protein
MRFDMKYIRYYLLMVLILAAAGVITWLLFNFAQASKPLYIAFSVMLFAAVVFYFLFNRYREKARISPKGEVRKRYLKAALTVFITLIAIGAAAVLVRTIMFLI